VVQVDVVEYLVDHPVRARFEEQRKKFSSRNSSATEILVFHGTPDKSVTPILYDGYAPNLDTPSSLNLLNLEKSFKAGGTYGIPVVNGQSYGVGVYTATGPTTPLEYNRGSTKVILAHALPGVSSKENNGLCNSWKPRADWVVFKEGSQLLPRYVIHLQNRV
jgi:hypothetical protein